MGHWGDRSSSDSGEAVMGDWGDSNSMRPLSNLRRQQQQVFNLRPLPSEGDRTRTRNHRIDRRNKVHFTNRRPHRHSDLLSRFFKGFCRAIASRKRTNQCQCAPCHSRLRRCSRMAKKKIRGSTHDLRIAASCVVNSATLVTRNRRDFRNFPGLSVEFWD